MGRCWAAIAMLTAAAVVAGCGGGGDDTAEDTTTTAPTTEAPPSSDPTTTTTTTAPTTTTTEARPPASSALLTPTDVGTGWQAFDAGPAGAFDEICDGVPNIDNSHAVATASSGVTYGDAVFTNITETLYDFADEATAEAYVTDLQAATSECAPTFTRAEPFPTTGTITIIGVDVGDQSFAVNWVLVSDDGAENDLDIYTVRRGSRVMDLAVTRDAADAGVDIDGLVATLTDRM